MDSEKVLLVSPAGRAASQRPPFALMCIASYLEKNAIPTDIIDIKGYEPKEKITSEILSEIKKRDADIIGTTCLTTELREILELCREIKILKPDAKIIAGGIHPSLIPEELVFRNSPVDFAVMGEGEQTFLELVQAIRKDSNVAGVKGIAWHKNNRLAKTPARPYIKDLDLLPFPAFDKIDMNFYTKPDFYCIRGIPIAGFYTYTSRGCPYRCRFCVNKNIFGRMLRFRSPKLVGEEVQILKDKYKIDGLYVYDDTFTVNKEHVLSICREFRERKLDLIWACETRVHLVYEDLMREMKKSGCIQIDFGVESGSQEVLDRLQKDITVEQIKNAFRICKKTGIRTFANFMLNTPEETEDDVQKTISLARELNATVSIFNITTPFPGTDIYDDIGGVPQEDYDKMGPNPSGYETWLDVIERKYRFAKHKIPFSKLIDDLSKEFPNVHELSFKNPKHLAHLWNNLSFILSPQYLRTMLKSGRKMQYVNWIISLKKVLQAQQFIRTETARIEEGDSE